jgi:hypothetical protein
MAHLTDENRRQLIAQLKTSSPQEIAMVLKHPQIAEEARDLIQTHVSNTLASALEAGNGLVIGTWAEALGVMAGELIDATSDYALHSTVNKLSSKFQDDNYNMAAGDGSKVLVPEGLYDSDSMDLRAKIGKSMDIIGLHEQIKANSKPSIRGVLSQARSQEELDYMRHKGTQLFNKAKDNDYNLELAAEQLGLDASDEQLSGMEEIFNDEATNEIASEIAARMTTQVGPI